jgi:RNA polymerase sigma factor (sigma-70 family)
VRRGLHPARERKGLLRGFIDRRRLCDLARRRKSRDREIPGLGLRTTTCSNDLVVATKRTPRPVLGILLIVLLISPSVELPTGGRRSSQPDLNTESDGRDLQFRDLYDRFVPRVRRYFFSRTHDPEAADELTSATFQILWEHPDWRTTPDGARQSLFIVAYRLLGNHRRSVERHRQLLGRLSGLADARDEVTDRDETEEYALLAVPGLRSREQAALRLIYWEQMSYVEAAEELHCSVNALRIVLSRAQKKLAGRLGTATGWSREL